MDSMKNEKYHRRSLRLPGYDYASEGGYFITCVTHNREHLFGEIVNGEMRLNDFGRIVQEEWFESAQKRANIELIEDEFVVMPNHIHGIVWIIQSDDSGRGTARCAPTINSTNERKFGQMIPGSIPVIVRAFKAAVTKRINEIRNTPTLSIWQRNYYEHIISTEKEYENIVNYIDSNPANWESQDEYYL